MRGDAPEHSPRAGIPGARAARLVGWRLHRLRPTPVAGAVRLVTSRGTPPRGPSLISLAVRSPEATGLQILCRSGEGRSELIHELEVPAGERRFEHLVGIPRDAYELLLRAAPGRPAPAVATVEVREMAPLPLAAVLSLRWLSHQLREPRRLPQKLRHLAGVLAREGIRGAIVGIVASQAARQAEGPWIPGVAEPAADAAPVHPPWEGAHQAPPPTTKRAFDERQRRELAAFLARRERLRLPASQDPAVSVIIVTFNRAELTLACLRHLAANLPPAAEVIVVDNASTDDTRSLLATADGAEVVENRENVGFLRACNQGVQRAGGRHVLLLNSDAFLLPGAVEAAIETLESDPGIGVVGGALLALDGTLQEAGSIVWGDGSGEGYGRGDDPGRPEYRFRRDVDYVSGAFLLTRRELWTKLGGFDEAYAPAYYEDVDYCLRARDAGFRVVYEPLAAAVHYEYGSSAGASAAVAMRRGRGIFLQRHGETLQTRPRRGEGHPLAGRSSGQRGRVLVVDDRVPLGVMGSGSPRMAAILRALVALDREVTFYPGLPFSGSWQDVYAEIPPEVEVMLGWDRRMLGRFLEERRGHYHHVVVSRAHNMAILNDLLEGDPGLAGDAILVYDAEAIAAMRAVTEPAARGVPLTDEEARRVLGAEARVAARAHRVAAVAPREADVFRHAGMGEVHLLPHPVPARPTEASFDERRSFLFVGRLSEDLSPNADGLRWFVAEVWPRIRETLGEDAELLVAGRLSPTLSALRGGGVRLLGAVDDLLPLYERARAFMAPLRFGAGIPLKIMEAASHGVPVVATELLREQLGWAAGEELLIAPVGDAATFARHSVALFRDEALWWRIREAALSRLRATATMDQFVAALREVLGDRGAPATSPTAAGA